MTSIDTNIETASAPATEGARKSSLRGMGLIAALLIIAIAAWGCMQFAFAADGDDTYATVTDATGTTHHISLGEDGTYPIETDLGTNVIVVEGGKAHMESADCPGHDCIDQGAIGSAGEIIVCLPHKLIVSVESASGADGDAMDTMAG